MEDPQIPTTEFCDGEEAQISDQTTVGDVDDLEVLTLVDNEGQGSVGYTRGPGEVQRDQTGEMVGQGFQDWFPYVGTVAKIEVLEAGVDQVRLGQLAEGLALDKRRRGCLAGEAETMEHGSVYEDGVEPVVGKGAVQGFLDM